MSNKRCINLDWLEVYALEPIDLPHDIEYFMRQGFKVEDRGYGTRIYEEMFFLYDSNDEYKLIEVRRNPKQKDSNAVLPINACHIRLTNRSCYHERAANLMKEFLSRYNYEFVRISRVDIALDFERFDSGDDPLKFIRRYMNGRYSKINQANVHAHGDDTWNKREWYSLSWGSPKSQIGTKLYLKTKELEEVGDKPYIRQAWLRAGIVNDPWQLIKVKADGTTYKPNIWRLEFTIRSDVKGWYQIEKDGDQKKIRSFRNTLEMYDGETALLVIFMSLQEHYFHFRCYAPNKTKYDCERKELFRWSTSEEILKPEHPSSDSKPLSSNLRLLKYIKAYQSTVINPNEFKACSVIIAALEMQEQRRILEHPYDNKELRALQHAVSLKMAGSEEDIGKLLEMCRELVRQQKIF